MAGRRELSAREDPVLTAIRWKLAAWICREMAGAAPDLRSALLEIYNWTQYKGTPWAKRANAALNKAAGVKP